MNEFKFTAIEGLPNYGRNIFHMSIPADDREKKHNNNDHKDDLDAARQEGYSEARDFYECEINALLTNLRDQVGGLEREIIRCSARRRGRMEDRVKRNTNSAV